MAAETVSVLVNGQFYQAWEHVKIEAAVKHACRSASLTAATALGASATHALFANFTLPVFTVSATNNPPGAGTVSGTGSYYYGATTAACALSRRRARRKAARARSSGPMAARKLSAWRKTAASGVPAMS